MSIAVSAIIKPSKTLFVIVSFMSLGMIVLGALVVLIQMALYANWLRLSVMMIFTLLAGILYHQAIIQPRVIRIDISGIGQIRLFNESHRDSDLHPRSGHLMRLIPGSTLWTGLLLLRMQDDIGQTKVLIVLPDSLADDGFRSLSVACRWIAGHNNSEKCNII
ncbi:MAG: hypothetical protein H7315_12305 [Herminiimonas sp.]|nr:hypothetical protein [Herminiimonas sp.]